jgi:hypothetical protein
LIIEGPYEFLEISIATAWPSLRRGTYCHPGFVTLRFLP